MDLSGLNYPLFDFTSSGLTHTWSRGGEEVNPYRISDFVIALNFGLIIIDWQDGKSPLVTFRIIGEGDQLLYEYSVSL